MQTFLKVTAIQNQVANNGRNFQKVTFNEVQFANGMTIKTTKSRTRNLWAEGQTADGKTVKADNLYNQLQVGELVAGSIETFNTTTFQIDGRDVNKTTQVVFEGEDAVRYTNSQLRQNGAVVVDEHGQLTAAIPTTFAQAEKVVTKVNEEAEIDF